MAREQQPEVHGPKDEVLTPAAQEMAASALEDATRALYDKGHVEGYPPGSTPPDQA